MDEPVKRIRRYDASRRREQARENRARVLSAARDASAYEFLQRLPEGLDTPLDEAPMSGGEIQRLGLARALAHADQARLLILDDAMSSLDTVTEMPYARPIETLSIEQGQTALRRSRQLLSFQFPLF